MPHALTEDHSAEDSRISHAAAWLTSATESRMRAAPAAAQAKPVDTAPVEAGCGPACKCD